MSHIKDWLKKQLPPPQARRSAQPWDRFTRKELWAHIEELETKLGAARRGLQEASSIFNGRKDYRSRDRMSEIAGRCEARTITLKPSQ